MNVCIHILYIHVTYIKMCQVLNYVSLWNNRIPSPSKKANTQQDDEREYI